MIIEYNDYLPGNTQKQRDHNLDLLREGVVGLKCTSVGEHTKEEEDMIKHKLTSNERISSVERYEGDNKNFFIRQKNTGELIGLIRVRN